MIQKFTVQVDVETENDNPVFVRMAIEAGLAMSGFNKFLVGPRSRHCKVIRIHETIFRSIVSDIFTFGAMGGLFYLNHRLLSGSGVVDVLVWFCITLTVIAKSSKSFTVKTATEFLLSDEAAKFIPKK